MNIIKLLSSRFRSTYNTVTLLLSLEFFQSFTVLMSVIVLFFQSLGLGAQEIFALQAIFAIALLCLEVISGYFADTFGRVTSIRIGTIAIAIGWTLYYFATGFWTLALAEVVLALGVAAISGSDSALLFDYLKEQNKEDQFKKYQGRLFGLSLGTEAVAAILGGLIISLSFNVGLLLQIVFALCAVVISFLITDTKQREKAEGSAKELWGTVVQTFQNSALRRLMLYGSILGSATLSGVWFFQLYLQEAQVDVIYFGFFWAAMNLVGAGTGLLAHRIEKVIGIQRGLQLLVLLVFLGFLGASIYVTAVGALFFFLFSIARGLNRTLLEDSIQQLIDSKTRATVMSIGSMLLRLSFAIVGVFLGVIVDEVSLQTALIASAILFCGLALLFKKL